MLIPIKWVELEVMLSWPSEEEETWIVDTTIYGSFNRFTNSSVYQIVNLCWETFFHIINELGSRSRNIDVGKGRGLKMGRENVNDIKFV